MSGDRRVITPGSVTPGARVGRPVRTGWTASTDQIDPEAIGVLTRTAPDTPAQFLPIAYHHEQPVAVETWLIAHDLPFTPSGLDVRGDDGRHMYPKRTVHSGPGRTRLEFPRPVAGTADLS